MRIHHKTLQRKYEPYTIEEIVSCKKETNVFYIVKTDQKGRCVHVRRPFAKNECIIAYTGELISSDDGFNENLSLSHQGVQGGYTYWLGKWKGQELCIDATSEKNLTYGRLINHSCVDMNIKGHRVEHKGRIHIIFKALRAIAVDEELLYDYGTKKESCIKHHPWMHE